VVSESVGNYEKASLNTGLFFFILMEHRLGGGIKNGPKIKID